MFTPGHTDDSLSLLLPAEKTLLTGDMVLGRGTTVDRLAGRRPRLLLRVDRADARPRRLRCGGDPLARRTARCSTTRSGCSSTTSSTASQRLAQVEGALVQLDIETPDLEDEELPRQVVEIVYQDVDESLWGAAEWSVRAQLALPGRASLTSYGQVGRVDDRPERTTPLR